MSMTIIIFKLFHVGLVDFFSHNDLLPHLLADDNAIVPVRLVRSGVDAHFFESYSNKAFITRDGSAGSYLIR